MTLRKNTHLLRKRGFAPLPVDKNIHGTDTGDTSARQQEDPDR